MDEKIPTSLEPILVNMKAEIELLQYVTISLCISTLPPVALDRLIERLDTPIVADWPEADQGGMEAAELTEVMHNAIGHFIHKLEKSRPVVPKDHG